MRPIFEKGEYLNTLKRKPWKLPKIFFGDLKCCYQRIVKGYCDRDVRRIWDWFLTIMPSMLRELSETAHGFPVNLDGTDIASYTGQLVDLEGTSEDAVKWKGILERIAFLFSEADEDTCQRKNPYKEEHLRIIEAFWEEYGIMGEGLCTPEELELERTTGAIRTHHAKELPEYRELEEAYDREERAIEEYRNQCKDEAFEMFCRYFWGLWD